MKNLLMAFALLTAVSCASTKKYTEAEILAESKEVNEFFAQEFAEGLERNPELYTEIGQKKRYNELNDISHEKYLKDKELTKESYKKLKSFNYDALDEETKLSYRLYKKMLEDSIKYSKYDYHRYYVNQMFGYHSKIPNFMINKHRIDNKSDAEAYIKRIQAVEANFEDLLDSLKRQKKMGIKYPHLVFDKVISDSRNLLKGYPFEGKGRSTFYDDFKTKVSKLKISTKERKALERKLAKALKESVKPAYESLIAYMDNEKKSSTEINGVWALPDGKNYYNYRLSNYTTTDLKAPEIHKIGLKEVDRIQNEMRAIMKKVNFDGSLNEFFEYVKNRKDFFYPDTKKGKEQYLKDAKSIISKMEKRLGELFTRLPKADLVVKPVEPFREKSAGIAFYNPPSLDGSRPGIYYVNLSDMKSVAKYDMEALAYHEALPGHHMDNALNVELQGVPLFRKFMWNSAYGEGWGLYAEYIPKEIGFYKDPYSDFGRLSMELWRATRLVVDTGIHYYKWDRDKALNYLRANTPNSEDEITKGVDRYIVMPGQATSYKIGQLKILELREKAKQALKDKFDIREFHDTLLGNGAVPLYELDYQISKYIDEKKI